MNPDNTHLVSGAEITCISRPNVRASWLPHTRRPNWPEKQQAPAGRLLVFRRRPSGVPVPRYNRAASIFGHRAGPAVHPAEMSATDPLPPLPKRGDTRSATPSAPLRQIGIQQSDARLATNLLPARSLRPALRSKKVASGPVVLPVTQCSAESRRLANLFTTPIKP
jgi:hypothetical protein